MNRPDHARRLRIAMVGTRGVPAKSGGIERHVEELGARLAGRGHEVVVFSRTNYQGASGSYRGITLRPLRTVDSKHLDAIVHSASATARVLGSRFDVVHYHALGPGILTPVARIGSGAAVVQTVHGLDHQRAKWGPAARTVLGTGAWLSERVPDALIAVSQSLEAHYRGRGRTAHYIPNGVVRPGPRKARGPATQRLGLGAADFVLFVGRLVPEKAPDLLVAAFRRVAGPARLVVVGDPSFTDHYVADLRRLASCDDRVVLAGSVYGDELHELYDNAAAFVLPSHLEGLPLTLLEAASHGAPVVASDIPPHVEVLGESSAGRRLVPVGEVAPLADAITTVLQDQAAERAGAELLRREVIGRYDWDDVAAQTEALYWRAVDGHRIGPKARRIVAPPPVTTGASPTP